VVANATQTGVTVTSTSEVCRLALSRNAKEGVTENSAALVLLWAFSAIGQKDPLPSSFLTDNFKGTMD
jgi:hypothetical protein